MTKFTLGDLDAFLAGQRGQDPELATERVTDRRNTGGGVIDDENRRGHGQLISIFGGDSERD